MLIYFLSPFFYNPRVRHCYMCGFCTLLVSGTLVPLPILTWIVICWTFNIWHLQYSWPLLFKHWSKIPLICLFLSAQLERDQCIYAHVRGMSFQREVPKKIHCCCIEGGIYNLKNVCFLFYFYPSSTWHETWIITRWNSNINARIVVNLLTK
jgi:hypothetical protein